MSDDEGELLRRALDGKTGRDYWRALAELAGGSPPRERADGIDRRSLLKLLGASMALAGVAGCQRDVPEKIMPYTVTPRGVTPGIPRWYATSMALDGYATGLLVRSNDGRPTKIEGNPDHPASLGATTAIEQASILGLYDPHRARAHRAKGGAATWDAFVRRFSRPRGDRGAGLRFLLEPTSSPTVEALIARVRERFPEARFTFHSPAIGGGAREGARAVLGAPLVPRYDFREAKVVLSLDADFLSSMPFSVRYSRHFAERRRVAAPGDPMSRLYVVETAPSPTGTLADHRLRRRPSEIAIAAANVAAELFLGLGARPEGLPEGIAAALQPFRARRDQGLVQALARDLKNNAGKAAVIVGDRQPPVVHALGLLVQRALGETRAIDFIKPALIGAGPAEQDLPALVEDLRRRRVDTLVILGANAAYTAPPEDDLARLVASVPDAIYLGHHEDETARACGHFVPAAHYLEAWGDARAYDGTISLVQPLVAPLFGGRTEAEILAVFAGDLHPSAHRLLRERWTGDERSWQEALRRGFVPGSEAPREAVKLAPEGALALVQGLREAAEDGSIEISFALDASVHDGRFANNGWLQELPDPITKLTWDNAAWLSPATAARLGVESGTMVELALGDRKVQAPVIVVPGHADDAVTAHLGYGRSGAEALAAGVGFNAYLLRTRGAQVSAPGLGVIKTGAPKHRLAVTQGHWSMEGRPIALSSTRAQYEGDPHFTEEHKGAVVSLLRAWDQRGDQWAMTIDTSICTGCSSCVAACQAENNTPIVGKEGVLRSREMHWLRIDTYHRGDAGEPSPVHQPMLCQHCEKAPCEYVCPVNATVHSPDGLNEMVYNRCVGTRFCSNNCPYKVRRFNWFDWSEEVPSNTGLVRLQKNPEVTVRERGVMEKCTYCVQRIRSAEIAAQIERRPIRPGEVVTACQQACPTRAIQFGSLSHRDTEMVKWREEPRSYAVLHDLGTQPRTMYLARIDNPNPEVE